MRIIFISILLMGFYCYGANKVGYTKNGFVGELGKRARTCKNQSTSATFVNCLTLKPAANSVWKIRAQCVGIRDDNAEFDTIEKTALFKRAGGSTAIQGSLIAGFNQPGTSGWDITIDVNSDTVRVRTNSPLETVDWRCTIDILRIKG